MSMRGLRVRGSSAGFTLLELMLVVVILASVAWMITGTTTDNISQVRYEDTRNRLDAIREAIMGPTGATAMIKGLQSGYIVDNGKLPENIRLLVENPDDDDDGTLDYDEFGPVDPVFDPVPDADGYNDGGPEEVTLSNAEHRLMKGHRGSYLPASGSGTFRDGWGTVRSSGGDGTLICQSADDHGYSATESSDDDDVNFGWCVTTYDPGAGTDYEEFYVDSFGMDGLLTPVPTGTDALRDAYEKEMPLSQPILVDDWTVPIAGHKVRVVNKSGADINLSSGVSLYAALLIYSNDTSGSPSWTAVVTEGSTLPISSLDDGDQKDGSSGSAWSAQNEFDLSFSSSVEPVPVGEHLLVLIYKPGGIDTDTPDLSEILNTGSVSGWPSTSQYVTARVKFYPRGGVPDLELEIR